MLIDLPIVFLNNVESPLFLNVSKTCWQPAPLKLFVFRKYPIYNVYLDWGLDISTFYRLILAYLKKILWKF